MKNGNVTVMAVCLVLIASIAFAGGYFLALDGGSSSEDVKILRETVARQKDAIQAFEGNAQKSNSGNERNWVVAGGSELSKPKTPASTQSIRDLLFQAHLKNIVFKILRVECFQ